LDPQRERLQDDLRGLVAGQVRCDDVIQSLFSSDGSIYEIRPLGVVRPRTTADVAAVAEYATANGIPLHARGAGTGTAGESLGPGLVIDFSRHMRRVIDTTPDSIRVQPGIVLEQLNTHLRNFGRTFGPDPGTARVSTVGGVLSVDGGGSRWLKYGSPRRHVLDLQVVLADGLVLHVGREPLVNGVSEDPNSRKRDLINAVVGLLRSNEELIQRRRPLCQVDRCGYRLWDVLTPDSLDLAGLLTGSEGTLALFTEVHLATEPRSRCRGVAALLFDSLEKAARAARDVLSFGPSACDLLDRRRLILARETEVHFDLLIPADTEAALLVEQLGDDLVEVRARMHQIVERVCGRLGLAFAARQAFDPVEAELYWSLTHKVQPWLHRFKGTARPVPVVDDVAVPPEILPEFLVRVQNVLKRQQVIASITCHMGQGQIHLQPFLDLNEPADVQKMRSLADDLYQEVWSAGGTISGQSACGLSRTPYVRGQFGELYDVLAELKQIFDPKGILNPGKVIGDDPDLLIRNLRPSVVLPAGESGEKPPEDSPRLRNLVELQLNWDPAQVVHAARACNGCGECRLQTRETRMCPIFRIMPGEEASPRAKANLIREVLCGALPVSALGSEEAKTVADLCVNCHMCAQECPAKVDIPKLVLEAKGAYVAAHGLSAIDTVFCRMDLLSGLASQFSTVVNWALRNRVMRWLLEKTLGIAQGRKLPQAAPRTFLRTAARRRLTRPTRSSGRKVALFVDFYVNYHDPQLGEAAVAVLEHNGVSVYVPPEQKQAGSAAFSCGALDIARKLADHNVALLAEAIRQGHHVVTTEPSAALTIMREYANVLNDDDVRLVAENTSELCTYLWKMHAQGQLQLDFHPINASLGYHMPCRLMALQVGSPGEHLLGLIPGLGVTRCEEGCSGMAGAWGLKRENYRASLRAGLGLISRLRAPAIQAGTTECSTCKMQMEQGTRKPTVHPIKLLALSYGLMPEVADLLTTAGEDLVVT
jgi:FAD/FMN-containing dehydrogenase/Fe-S oxidoreductase